MIETRDTRLRRLRMRSMRRGIKEMDIILSTYAAVRLDKMTEKELVAYDALLSENDQDLYQWVSGQRSAPDDVIKIIKDIAKTVEK